MSLDEISGMLRSHPRRHLTFYTSDGKLAKKSFLEIHNDVEKLKAEFVATGICSRSVVGLVGPNSYTWLLADLALLGIGALSIAFPEAMLSGGDLVSLGEKYELDYLLFSTRRANSRSSYSWVGSLDQRPVGLDIRRSGSPGRQWPEDVFSLSFSSGTTGGSKCLMMSKKGIENTIVISGEAWGVDETDNIFITMPFSSFQQRTMAYMAIWHGFDISMAPPERMRRALKEMSPTIFIGPPSFFEFVENEYYSAPMHSRFVRATVATLAGKLLPHRTALKIKRALFEQFHRPFGSRMRLLLVGSAPSKLSMLELYDLLGLPLYQVYGVTEFGWISFNLPGANRIGTVGKVVKGVKTEIASDGEVIVSGPFRQTLGYVFDGESQQHAVYLSGSRVATGDTGRIDAEGYLNLVGRKKNIIITKGGYKINPETIEAAIERIAAVERAVVFGGDQLSTLVCVIWLGDPAQETTRAEIRAAIDLLNKSSPAQERIGKIVFKAASELTVESSLLTRTFKVNRTAVFERYKDVITNDSVEG
jgi:long-subunit acyl-CoA synthetase (AMP-forming)